MQSRHEIVWMSGPMGWFQAAMDDAVRAIEWVSIQQALEAAEF